MDDSYWSYPKGGTQPQQRRSLSQPCPSLGESVGKVLKLGVLAEVEVLDIDAAATAKEVFEALQDTIPCQKYPEANKYQSRQHRHQ